jgi:hypothetical protein
MMNLNRTPTAEQLAALLAACNDAAAPHILWTAHDGEVRVTPLPDHTTPAAFGERPDLRFRYETYLPDNGYVGPTAAADKGYVQKLFDELLRDWRDGRTDLVDY